MTAGMLDHIIMQTIATELGLPESSKFPFLFDCAEGIAEVRLPAPGANWLDYQLPLETSDVIGKGETIDEALADACVSYRIAARDTVLSGSLNASRKVILQ
ncbi:MAG: hypothetical protein WC814_01250 [Candidatus Paceibacterota bacterium]|jgi:hypothetical protein